MNKLLALFGFHPSVDGVLAQFHKAIDRLHIVEQHHREKHTAHRVEITKHEIAAGDSLAEANAAVAVRAKLVDLVSSPIMAAGSDGIKAA